MIVQVVVSTWNNTLPLIFFGLVKFALSLVLPAFFIFVCLAFIFAVNFFSRSFSKFDFGLIFSAYAFGVLALVVGQLLGASRSPAVAQFLPASLSFIGGLSVYVVAKDSEKTRLVSVILISFSVFLHLGSVIGAKERDMFVASSKRSSLLEDIENVSLFYEELMARTAVEKYVNYHRSQEGLDTLPYDIFFPSF